MQLSHVRRRRACTLLAAAAYLVVAVWTLGSALVAPTRLLPYNAALDPAHAQLGHFDQAMVVSVITRNADTLLREPSNLLGDGQCYPFPRPFTLGEHMLGEGLLALLPWALTGDPILTYNALLILTLWIPGLTMYALAQHFTRSPAAAFVAGLVFQLEPSRIIDGGHPYLHGDLWTPLALLFLHRVFVHGGIANAIGLGFFLALEALETIYLLIACAILAGVYTLHLLARYRDRLRRVLPPLVLGVSLPAVVACAVLAPYFETRATWNLLAGRASVFLPWDALAFGTIGFPGLFLLAFSALGLIDRWRRVRAVDGDDPRMAFFLGGVVALWSSLWSVPLPGTGIEIPSPLRLLAEIVPGADAVRSLFAVLNGAWLPFAFLCGYGALVLIEHRRQAVGAMVAAAASLLLLAERFVPLLAHWNFGSTVSLASYTARPPAKSIEIVRLLPEGPVLDIPMAPPERGLARLAMSNNLLLLSYNPRPSASCYNSFDTPLAAQMQQLADALPDPDASEALAGLGFRTVISHVDRWWPSDRLDFASRWTESREGRERLVLEREAEGMVVYRLEPRAPAVADFSLLTSEDLTDEVIDVSAPRAKVDFLVTNRGEATFRHPAPLAPSDLIVRWRRVGSERIAEQTTRAMLPIALGPDASMRIAVETAVPAAPGLYRVSIARGAHPDVTLATRRVRVSLPPTSSST